MNFRIAYLYDLDIFFPKQIDKKLNGIFCESPKKGHFNPLCIVLNIFSFLVFSFS